VQMWLRECKRECTGSSRMCFKSRRRHGEQELVLANRRRAWQLGVMAAQRGGARRGPARVGERRRGCWGGTWRRGKRCGGSRCSAHGRHGRQGVGRRENREKELEVDEGGLICYFPKVQGLHYKA
jgi:hypothetical protein